MKCLELKDWFDTFGCDGPHADYDVVLDVVIEGALTAIEVDEKNRVITFISNKDK